MAVPAFVDDILAIGTWKRGDVRAPHKPLLLLLALARLRSGEPRLMAYEDIERLLRGLLLDFGPPRKNHRAFYPFWRLQSDGDFWEIPEREHAITLNRTRVRQDDIPAAILKSVNAHGGFTAEVAEFFRTHPRVLDDTVESLLEAHFPPTMHKPILDAVGLTRPRFRTKRNRQSTTFREDVLRLYGRRCAICEFDGRLGVADLALEAAHVMWHSYDGPDEPCNGLLLCTLHHILLDRGAIGISDERTILVSQHVSGSEQVKAYVTRFAGKPIGKPLDSSCHIGIRYISWHRAQVFRDPPLPPTQQD